MVRSITFIVRSLAPDWPDIASLDEASVIPSRARFRRGVENWIVQGYLRLRAPLEARGFHVAISDRFPRRGICIAHRDDLNRFADPLYDCFVIGVRADRPPVSVAHIEVVQNGCQLGRPSSYLIPHWPQPGLLPRDAARGASVTRAVYHGRESGAPHWYRDPAFANALLSLGVSFELRDTGWEDYRSADVVLAHRDETATMLANKPASKLVNAWLAGVPAVVAPEPAFLELRQGPLDFIAAGDARETVDAIAMLARDPSRYRAMVENGRMRSAQFNVEAIRSQWLRLICDVAVPAYENSQRRSGGLIGRYLRFLLQMSAQKMEANRFRAAERRERCIQ